MNEQNRPIDRLDTASLLPIAPLNLTDVPSSLFLGEPLTSGEPAYVNNSVFGIAKMTVRATCLFEGSPRVPAMWLQSTPCKFFLVPASIGEIIVHYIKN